MIDHVGMKQENSMFGQIKNGGGGEMNVECIGIIELSFYSFWTGDLVRFSGVNWKRDADDRKVWSARRETFIQQCTRDGCY